MSDNAKQVLIHLIWAVFATISVTVLLIGATAESLAKNPMVIRIEVDDNLVKISENIKDTQNTDSYRQTAQGPNGIIGVRSSLP